MSIETSMFPRRFTTKVRVASAESRRIIVLRVGDRIARRLVSGSELETLRRSLPKLPCRMRATGSERFLVVGTWSDWRQADTALSGRFHPYPAGLSAAMLEADDCSELLLQWEVEDAPAGALRVRSLSFVHGSDGASDGDLRGKSFETIRRALFERRGLSRNEATLYAVKHFAAEYRTHRATQIKAINE
jgi:hypothetical protein